MKWQIEIQDIEHGSVIGAINLNELGSYTRKELEFVYGEISIYLQNNASQKVIDVVKIKDRGEYFVIEVYPSRGTDYVNLIQQHELYNLEVSLVLGRGLAYVRKEDQDEIREIITKINTIDPLEEAFNEIYNFLQIKPEPSQEIANRILNLAQNVPFREVLQSAIKAQSDGYDNALLLLGKYYEDNLELNKAYDCYDAVLETNSKYAEVAYSKLHLLYNFYDNASSKDEIINYQEEQLRLAIKSGERGQSKVDQLFYALCGYETNIPDISGVQGNAETLISIARKMRGLNTIKADQLPASENPTSVTRLSFLNQTPVRTINEQESTVATERNCRCVIS